MRADAQASAKVAWPCVRCLDWEVPRCHYKPCGVKGLVTRCGLSPGIRSCTLAPPLAVRGHLSGWALVRQVDWRTLCSELLHWLTAMECPGPVLL